MLYGTEYSKEMINAALLTDNPYDMVPSRDMDGHGTFLAAIAGGNEDTVNDFVGAAPDAEFVIVKLKEAKAYLKNFFQIPQDALAYQSNDIMMGIKYLLNVAKKLRRPISICIGLGSNQGSRDGNELLSEYIGELAKLQGVSISIAAGNEVQAGHHYYGQVRLANEPDRVEIKVSNTKGFMLELWGDTPNLYSVGVKSPGGEVIPRIPARIDASREVNLLLEGTRVQIDYELVEGSSGDEVIVMIFDNPTPGIWTVEVYEDGLTADGFHMWLPIRNFLSEETAFVRPDPNTTLTTPTTSVSPISVAAYNHYNNSIYINSSRGFGRSGLIKPDLAAPGVNIYGPNLRGGFGVRSGTSIAAAHVTGAAALMLEWGLLKGNDTYMGGTQIKKYFIRGAVRDPNLTYPNREWGYGKLNLFQTFTSLIP